MSMYVTRILLFYQGPAPKNLLFLCSVPRAGSRSGSPSRGWSGALLSGAEEASQSLKASLGEPLACCPVEVSNHSSLGWVVLTFFLVLAWLSSKAHCQGIGRPELCSQDRC